MRHQINDFVYDCCAMFLTLPAGECLRVFLFLANCSECTTINKLDSLETVYYSSSRLAFEKAVNHFKENSTLVYDCLIVLYIGLENPICFHL